MKINSTENKISPKCLNVKTTLNLIGGKWKPLILYLLKDKIMRFSELSRGIEGITQKMLAQQLRELEKAKLITRKIYPQVPPRVEYTITSSGMTLTPIFKLMDEWAKTYYLQQNRISKAKK